MTRYPIAQPCSSPSSSRPSHPASHQYRTKLPNEISASTVSLISTPTSAGPLPGLLTLPTQSSSHKCQDQVRSPILRHQPKESSKGEAIANKGLDDDHSYGADESPIPQPESSKAIKGKGKAYPDEIDLYKDDFYENNEEDTSPGQKGPPRGLLELAELEKKEREAREEMEEKEAAAAAAKRPNKRTAESARKMNVETKSKSTDKFSWSDDEDDEARLYLPDRSHKKKKMADGAERKIREAMRPSNRVIERVSEPTAQIVAPTPSSSLRDEEKCEARLYLPERFHEKKKMPDGRERKMRKAIRPSLRVVKHVPQPTAQATTVTPSSDPKSVAGSRRSSRKRSHQELVDNNFTIEIKGTTREMKSPVTQSKKTPRLLSTSLPRARDE